MSWIPEYTQIITPDGKIYELETSDRWIITEEGLGMPEPDYITDKAPNQHGSTVRDVLYKERVIQLQLRQNNCDRFDYLIQRRKLVDYLRPDRQLPGELQPFTLRKLYPDGERRDLAVWISSGPRFAARNPDIWDEYGYTETLRFTANDPIFTDPTLHTETFTIAVTPYLTFPAAFPFWFDTGMSINKTIVYDGNFECYPTIEIHGPFGSPVITNLGTDEQIALNYAVSLGEIVTIDLTPGDKTITNQVGVDLYGTLVDPTDIATFHLGADPEVANGSNIINVTAGGVVAGQSALYLKYYRRFVGG